VFKSSGTDKLITRCASIKRRNGKPTRFCNADYQRGVGVVTNPRISACRRDRNEISVAISLFSGSSYSIVRVQYNQTGNRKSKTAASKPEVLIYQLVDEIATKFQRLSVCSLIQRPNGTSGNAAKPNRKSEHQDGSLKPEVLRSLSLQMR
jgi:hypothetical protein